MRSILFAAFAVFVLSLFLAPASADVQVNASVLNVAPRIVLHSDHSPINILSPLNSATNPAVCGGSQNVTFNVTFTDDNSDAGNLFICASNAMNANNLSCSGVQYCANGTNGTSPRTCTNMTLPCATFTNWTYNYWAFITDNSSVARYSSNGSYNWGVFYVDVPATVPYTILGNNTTAGGTFAVGDSINCSAFIRIPSNQPPINISYAVFGPNGTMTNLDFGFKDTGYDRCNGTNSSWSVGRLCSYAWNIPVSGATNGTATACRASKGTWNCTVNVTTQGYQLVWGSDTETLVNRQPNTCVSAFSGSLSPAAAVTFTTNYSDYDGYGDVSTGYCGGAASRCAGIMWAGIGANPTYQPGTWDTQWDTGADSVTGALGCMIGGFGYQNISWTGVTTNDKTLNGTWTVKTNITDVGGSARECSTITIGPIVTTAGTSTVTPTSVGWTGLTPGGGWVKSNSGAAAYVNYTHKGNYIIHYGICYRGNMSTDTTNCATAPYLEVVNIRHRGDIGMGADPDCTAAGTTTTPNTPVDVSGMDYVPRGSATTTDTGTCAVTNPVSCNVTRLYYCISVPTGVPAGTYTRFLRLSVNTLGAALPACNTGGC